MANKQGRVAALIQKNISDIIMFELKDDDMKLVNVSACDVTNDYSYCKVYLTHLDKNKTDQTVEKLNKLKGTIRTSLAHKMDIYKVPQLIFIKDDTLDKYERIEQILKEVNKK